MLMVIVMLNYLIAVISQAYEAVVNMRSIYGYFYKAQINLDYFHIRKQIDSDIKRVKFMISVESHNLSMHGGGNEWQGMVKTIQRHITKAEAKTRAGFAKLGAKIHKSDSEVKSQIDALRSEQLSMRTEMTSMKKAQDEDIKNMLQAILNKLE